MIFPFVVYWVPWLSWVIIEVDIESFDFFDDWLDRFGSGACIAYLVHSKNEVVCTPESKRLEPPKKKVCKMIFLF